MRILYKRIQRKQLIWIWIHGFMCYPEPQMLISSSGFGYIDNLNEMSQKQNGSLSSSPHDNNNDDDNGINSRNNTSNEQEGESNLKDAEESFQTSINHCKNESSGRIQYCQFFRTKNINTVEPTTHKNWNKDVKMFNDQCPNKLDLAVQERKAKLNSFNPRMFVTKKLENDHFDVSESVKPKKLPEYNTSRQNFVVDYGNLRRSGYFLRTSIPGKQHSDGKIEYSPNSRVDEWVNTLPVNAPTLRYSEDDMMGEKDVFDINELQSGEITRYMNEEYKFKLLILEKEQILNYSSRPISVLKSDDLEHTLELVNDNINEYIANYFKIGRQDIKQEYVSGIVDVPPTFISNFNTNTHNIENKDFVEQKSFPTGTFIIEPYHGPICMNGAKIKAGTVNIGVRGRAIEELKTVLRSIHQFLRNDNRAVPIPFVQHAPSASPTLSETGNIVEEDLEIRRLTEMVLSSKPAKKSTLRSVFGLRNIVNTRRPPHTVTYGHPPQVAQRRTFLQAMENWIRRRFQSNSFERNQGFQAFRELASIRRSRVHPEVRRQEEVNSFLAFSGSNLSSAVSNIKSFMRSIFPKNYSTQASHPSNAQDNVHRTQANNPSTLRALRRSRNHNTRIQGEEEL